MDNDPRKPIFQVGETAFPDCVRPKTDVSETDVSVQLTLPERASDPVTKQTARLNWKDFRLRATLYVSIGKGAERDSTDALGWWRYCDEWLLRVTGLRSWHHVKSSQGEAHAGTQIPWPSTVTVRVSPSSRQGERITGHP